MNLFSPSPAPPQHKFESQITTNSQDIKIEALGQEYTVLINVVMSSLFQ